MFKIITLKSLSNLNFKAEKKDKKVKSYICLSSHTYTRVSIQSSCTYKSNDFHFSQLLHVGVALGVQLRRCSSCKRNEKSYLLWTWSAICKNNKIHHLQFILFTLSRLEIWHTHSQMLFFYPAVVVFNCSVSTENISKPLLCSRANVFPRFC